MRNLQFNLYQCGAGRGGLGLKSLNPSLPHNFCETGKTYVGRSGEGRGKIAILSVA